MIIQNHRDHYQYIYIQHLLQAAVEKKDCGLSPISFFSHSRKHTRIEESELNSLLIHSIIAEHLLFAGTILGTGERGRHK